MNELPEYSEGARLYFLSRQQESIRKECEGCKQEVLLPPEYGYCDTCADARERGIEL